MIIEFISKTAFVLTPEARQELSKDLAPELLGSVWGIIDKCRSWTKYAPVIEANGVAAPDLLNARCFWNDQVMPNK